jgi:hypothetical protein
MNVEQVAIRMETVTDPLELSAARRQRAQFERNGNWLQTRVAEVYSKHRGQCICVAGQELFVAETAEQAIALATAHHPEDDGWFVRYIPKEKRARICAA